MQTHVLWDADQAGKAAARMVGRWLDRDVRRHGSASVAFSGGHAPLPMFAALATMPIAWDQVEVFQVDERVAPDGDPARNAAALANLPVPRRQMHLMPVTAADLDRAARRYATALPARLDVVVLGVGDDGHAASWPPGHDVVDASEPVRAIGEFNGWRRMTLTPSAVNGARRRLVLVPGADKAEVVARWMAGDRDLPITRVHRRATTVILDTAAAAALPAS
jgi:6-phosphogluconolactonase/glucosamine-6-phosphate isomerase/deaminase